MVSNSLKLVQEEIIEAWLACGASKPTTRNIKKLRRELPQDWPV